jgi:hypothetical protein
MPTQELSFIALPYSTVTQQNSVAVPASPAAAQH